MMTLKPWLVLLALVLAAQTTCEAAILPPQKLLPKDTLLVITVPDARVARKTLLQAPYYRLWRDPAMRPFRKNFEAQIHEHLLAPLEKKLGLNWNEVCQLWQGQFTFAVVQGGWHGQKGQSPNWVVLLDAKDRKAELEQTLAGLKQKWVDAGRLLRTREIRGTKFDVLANSTSSGSRSKPARGGASAKSNSADSSVLAGQFQSLLLVSNNADLLEKILARQSGGLVSALMEEPAYEKDYQQLFRRAPFYGWIHVAPILQALQQRLETSNNQNANSPIAIQPKRVLEATGLQGLKAVAFTANCQAEGSSMEIALRVPESERSGVFKILTPENQEAAPPPFVPANVIKFNRWRLNGKKFWNGLETMLTQVSPQLGGVLQMSLSALGKDKDPNFDFRESFIGNLGDDFISFQEAPSGAKPDAPGDSAPSLFLIGSPHPKQLAAALSTAASLVPGAGGGGSALTKRDFLGRTIFTLQLPGSIGGNPSGGRKVHFAGSGSYVALSSDVGILEGYLRGESAGKPLRKRKGLLQAAQHVGGMDKGLFGYENYRETLRLILEALRKNPEASKNLLAGLAPLGGAVGGGSMQQWIDLSLLPRFDQIKKYFSFTVYGASSDRAGIYFKVFTPVSAELQAEVK